MSDGQSVITGATGNEAANAGVIVEHVVQNEARKEQAPIQTDDKSTGSDAGETGDTGEEGKPKEPADGEEKALPKGVQRRIDRAVREKYQAQAKADALEQRLERLEAGQRGQQQNAGKPANNGEPKIADFNDFDEYVTAKARYIAKAELQEGMTAFERRSGEEKAQAAQRQTAEGWNKRVAAVSKEIPDFAEVVSGSDVPMSTVMQQVIVESEHGPKVAHYLATHEEEGQEIANMTPIAAVRALMRIEDKLKSKPTTATPAPISPTGSKSTAGVKALTDSMSQDEFEKRRRAFIKKR